MDGECKLRVESKGLDIRALGWRTRVGGDSICLVERPRNEEVCKELTAVYPTPHPPPSHLMKTTMWTVQIKFKVTNEFYTLRVGNCPEETLSQKFNLCLNPIGPILSKDFNC